MVSPLWSPTPAPNLGYSNTNEYSCIYAVLRFEAVVLASRNFDRRNWTRVCAFCCSTTIISLPFGSCQASNLTLSSIGTHYRMSPLWASTPATKLLKYIYIYNNPSTCRTSTQHECSLYYSMIHLVELQI